MSGVTILDRDPSTGVLSFDLRDILRWLGDDATRSVWVVRNVECRGGDAATELHEASDRSTELSGARLNELANGVMQVVDGEFYGRLPNESSAWITIRAVDSSAFDVETNREDILRALKANFSHVEDLPE